MPFLALIPWAKVGIAAAIFLGLIFYKQSYDKSLIKEGYRICQQKTEAAKAKAVAEARKQERARLEARAREVSHDEREIEDKRAELERLRHAKTNTRVCVDADDPWHPGMRNIKPKPSS